MTQQTIYELVCLTTFETINHNNVRNFFFSFLFSLSRGFSLHRDEDGGGGHSTAMENEKRMRREIANSNERRRMQSINAGFQSLRSLLPHHEGEKLSKVSAEMQNFTTTTTLDVRKNFIYPLNGTGRPLASNTI